MQFKYLAHKKVQFLLLPIRNTDAADGPLQSVLQTRIVKKHHYQPFFPKLFSLSFNPAILLRSSRRKLASNVTYFLIGPRILLLTILVFYLLGKNQNASKCATLVIELNFIQKNSSFSNIRISSTVCQSEETIWNYIAFYHLIFLFSRTN